jgi:hypothetical protein
MSKQLDLFGDYLIEDDYDALLEETTTEDLLSLIPDNSIIWFANLGEEIVGFSSEIDYPPQGFMFALIKHMNSNKDRKVYEILDDLKASIYIVQSEENADVD